MPLIVIIAIRSSPNKTPFSMREGRLAVGRYNSYHIVQKTEKRVCQNVYILFFYAQSPDFLKPGLCYFLKFLYL